MRDRLNRAQPRRRTLPRAPSLSTRPKTSAPSTWRSCGPTAPHGLSMRGRRTTSWPSWHACPRWPHGCSAGTSGHRCNATSSATASQELPKVNMRRSPAASVRQLRNQAARLNGCLVVVEREEPPCAHSDDGGNLSDHISAFHTCSCCALRACPYPATGAPA
jgi:hypothetical protein